MGLLDKFKNLFTDEEYVEEEKEIEEEIKIKPPKLPQVMVDEVEKNELNKEVLKEKDIVSDRTLVQTKTKFAFPVEFNDEDFKATRSSRNIVTKVKEQEVKNTKPLYSSGIKKETKTEKKFRCTPIISPVYGILDKNYKKEEVVSKEENKTTIQRPSKKIDFDSVRRKAFGDLTDDIKDNLLCQTCELYKESITRTRMSMLNDNDLLSEMTVDNKEEIKDEENYYDFGVSYTEKETITEIKPIKVEKTPIEKLSEELPLPEDDFPNNEELPSNEENDNILDDLIVNCNSLEPVAEKIETKEVPTRESKNKLDNLDLTDDLFNLIDSMYEDGE